MHAAVILQCRVRAQRGLGPEAPNPLGSTHPPGALIADDTGALADSGMDVRFLEESCTATMNADAVVIANDDPPPKESLQ